MSTPPRLLQVVSPPDLLFTSSRLRIRVQELKDDNYVAAGDSEVRRHVETLLQEKPVRFSLHDKYPKTLIHSSQQEAARLRTIWLARCNKARLSYGIDVMILAQEALSKWTFKFASLPLTNAFWELPAGQTLGRCFKDTLTDAIRERATRTVYFLDPNELAENLADCEESARWFEACESYLAVFQRCSPRDQQLLLMKEEGQTYEEIAETLGLHVDSVRRILRELRPLVEKALGVESETIPNQDQPEREQPENAQLEMTES